MEIGNPQKVIEAEPVQDPFRKDVPAPRREVETPEPVKTPEPERVGA
jgi:hypothetical protein